MNDPQKSFEQIPDELKALPQWAVSGPEYDSRNPKRPFNPITRSPASSTKSKSWVTFKQAVEAGAAHIGFVFSAHDP